MSWFEYSDMFEKAQSVGKYRCHVFDMKDSKTGYEDKKFRLLLSLFKEKVGTDCIHLSEQFPETPFITAGDVIVLITEKDAISDKEVYKLFKEAKKESGLNKKFHYLSGNYETDEWSRGNVEYYAGYCIPELEYRSKEMGQLL